jgi:hypothetical protein
MVRGNCVYLACVLVLSLSMIGVSHVLEDSGAMKNENERTPLRLRGRVVKVELSRQDAHGIVFDLRLSLELVNTSKQPVILLRRPFWLGSITLARSPEDAAANKYIYLSSAWPSVYRGGEHSEWKNLQQRLDQQSPPPDLTRILAPGESFLYETDATLYIEKPGSVDKTSQPWEIIRRASPVWLQVTLETWPVNVEPKVNPDNPEFGRMLQYRWQKAGKLQLEHLTSEPMQLSLPTSP